jgi:hypothetical protein
MKIYKASDELVNILLRHGFIERTAKSYFRDTQTLDSAGVYDPNTMRRAFVYKRAYYNRIFFDYGNVKVMLNNIVVDASFQLNELELRSILTFFSLSNVEKYKFINKTKFKPSEMHLYYAICVKHLSYSLTNAFEKKIMKVFESTVI